MKDGKSIVQLAKQIKAEREAKHDFIAPTTQLRFVEQGERGGVHFKIGNERYRTEPTRHCLSQICARSGIPKPYADKMIEAKGQELLAENINWWWKNQPEKRMIRTLMNGSNIARAFVSDVYRPLDNYDLAEIVLPKLTEVGCRVISSEITETRLYIQAATPRMELDLNALRAKNVKLKDVDPVQAGIVITNSEVGLGALAMDRMLFFLTCLNGAIAARVMRRHHVGRRHTDPLFELDNAAEYYTDKTKELDDIVFWNKVKDVVDAMFDMSNFQTLCQKFADSASVPIKATEAIEEITTRYKLHETEKNSVLDHLIKGGELNVYGLSAAVTRTSTDVESYDRAVELERIGGEIVELPRATWEIA
jgi:hypothetical protein